MADHGKKKRSLFSAMVGVFTGSSKGPKRKAKILEKKKEKKKKKGETLREKLERHKRELREAAKD